MKDLSSGLVYRNENKATTGLFFTVPIKTRNRLNGSVGVSRGAMFADAKKRKVQRGTVAMMTRAQLIGHPLRMPLKVTVIRVAPSNGLDPHDGLGPALKSVIDGITDALGLTNDRSPFVTWVLDQRRGAKGEYAVEIHMEERDRVER